MELYILKNGSGSANKHVPAVTINNDIVNVKIGVDEHPMTEEHFIKWIAIKTTKGYHIAELTHTDKPEATFELDDDETFIAAYEYCNLHGFWKDRVH